MTAITFRPVRTDDDLMLLDGALRALSADLGDTHKASRACLASALLSEVAPAHGLLAMQGETLCGAALFSPTYSTARGAAGVYVSDLWVDETVRGSGLGRRLLAAVVRRAAQTWRAEWLTLAVYDHSVASRAFYDRLGLVPRTGATVMTLDREGCLEMMKDTG
ncbi:acetyltransferase, GNAT family protein [Roseobacter sp. AzwK-3b]|uniref:GNAT family N-acetyltransferase n=1 Tax=Roseobacter sp. AzwK-3b TaxID=351016 RepID=UPI000156AEDE|nr:GNAT family N-acetyltransferase [Roseobacter sp. AzwK-3b]EDM69810.1 acetyltransferase, GNAT family protein [Roseobacter sp. AzwK-3b]